MVLPVIVTNRAKFHVKLERYPWALYIRLHDERETILPVSLLLTGSGYSPKYTQSSYLNWNTETVVHGKFQSYPIISTSDAQNIPPHISLAAAGSWSPRCYTHIIRYAQKLSQVSQKLYNATRIAFASEEIGY
jgi:hypothetical protein